MASGEDYAANQAPNPAKLRPSHRQLADDPRLTTTERVIGSPAYMTPEQAKGEETGPPADFWALGATLYFAVEGEPPAPARSSSEPPMAPAVMPIR
jgi:serine/threonine protein kinase